MIIWIIINPNWRRYIRQSKISRFHLNRGASARQYRRENILARHNRTYVPSKLALKSTGRKSSILPRISSQIGGNVSPFTPRWGEYYRRLDVNRSGLAELFSPLSMSGNLPSFNICSPSNFIHTHIELQNIMVSCGALSVPFIGFLQ